MLLKMGQEYLVPTRRMARGFLLVTKLPWVFEGWLSEASIFAPLD